MNLKTWAGYVSIAALFAIILVWGFLPGFQGWHGLTLLGVSVASFILWVVLSLDSFFAWFKKRSSEYYIALVVTGIALIAIAGTVNYLAFKYNKKWDLTLNKIHTLSEQSAKVASELKEEVTIRVWTTAVDRISPNMDMRRFLENYKIAAKGKIKIQISNPIEDPIGAKIDNVKRDNLFVVRAASGREIRIDNFSDSKGEAQITNAIVQAVKGSKKTVCFLSGHGELSLSDSEPTGLSKLRDLLNDSSYTTKEISISASGEGVPTDCEALAIMGPKGNIPDQELRPIQDYLSRGGKLLAAFGYGTQGGWKKLVAEYGVELMDDFVLELRSDQPALVGTRNFSRDTEITKNSNIKVFFMQSSSLRLPTASTYNGATVKSFISTEATSVSKKVITQGRVSLAPAPGDRRGPLPIAALVVKPVASAGKTQSKDPPVPALPHKLVPEKAEGGNKSGFLPRLINKAYAQDEGIGVERHGELSSGNDGPKVIKKETNIIVYSSSLFAANGVLDFGGNMDLVLNSIAYLLKDQELIGIRPREMKGATLELTAHSIRQVYATIFFLSALFFFFAILAVKRKFVRD